MFQIQKSSDRSMMHESSHRRKMVNIPVYIAEKQISDGVITENQMSFRPSHINHNRKTQTRLTKRTPSIYIVNNDGVEIVTSSSTPDSSYVKRANLLIWISFVICSTITQAASPLSWIDYLDMITVGFTVFVTIFNIINNKRKFESLQALYLWNLTMTIGYYLDTRQFIHKIFAVSRTFRIFSIILVYSELCWIVESISKAIKHLWKSALGILIICFIYCIVGIQLYKGATQYRCRPTLYPTDQYWESDGTDQLCGFRDCPSGYYCLSALQYGLIANPQQFTEAVNYGYTTFDNIFSSFLTVFNLMFAVGWSEITFIHAGYYCKYITYIFMLSFIIVGPFILMNILVGLLYEQYQKNIIMKELGKQQGMQKKNESIKVSKLAHKLNTLELQAKENVSQKQEPSNDSLQTVQKRSFKCSDFKKLIFQAVILTQIVSVCLDHYRISDLQNRIIGVILGVCFIIYTLEIITIVFKLTEADQYKNRYRLIINMSDCLIFVINLVAYISKGIAGLYILEDSNFLSPIAQSLLCLRLFKILQYNMIDQNVIALLHAFYQTIIDLMPFLAVIGVVTLFGAAASMQLYHGMIKKIGDTIVPRYLISSMGTSPVINFDTYLNSWVSFTSFILNQQWQLTLFNLMKSGDNYAIIYFLIVILVGQVLIIRLFVVVYINKYLEKVKLTKVFEQEVVDKTTLDERIVISLRQKSLFLFDHDNYIRKKCIQLIKSQYYHHILVLIIIFYAFMLTLQDLIISSNANIVYIAFDAIFMTDMVIKIIAFKMFGDYSYSRDGSNLLDFAINVLVIFNSATNMLKVFIRAIRACRIMRLTQLFSSLNILTISVFKSLGVVLRLIPLLLIFLLFFSSLSMKYLKGTTYQCSLTNRSTMLDCMDYGGNWKNLLGVGYDNIFQSVFNTFSIITSEGWLKIMTIIQRISGQNKSVNKTIDPIWGLFFMPMFFIGNLIFINIFVGVLIQKVQSISNAFDEFETSIKNLPGNRQEWARIKNYIYKIQPEKSFRRPTNLKKYLYDLLQSDAYKYITKFFLVLNLIVFASFTYRQNVVIYNMLSVLNNLCFFIFVLQYGYQVFLYGWQRRYLYFDLVAILISIPGVFLIYFPIGMVNTHEYSNLSQTVMFFNALQIIRCYKIFVELQSLSNFFHSIVSILPKVGSVFGLFFLILYVSAILSEDLFSDIKYNNSILPDKINFDTFFDSIFALFKIATNQAWFTHAVDLSRQLQFGYFCGIINSSNQQCGSRWNLLFFIVFFLIVGIIMINLLVATILMLTVQSLNLEKSATSRYKLKNFSELWKKYDLDGEGSINYKTFFQFSMVLAMQYGINKDQFHKIEKKKMFMRILDIPLYENLYSKQYCYLIHDVGIGMSRAALLLKQSQSFEFLLYQKISPEISLDSEKKVKKYKLTNMNSGNMATVILMSEKFRKWKKRAMRQEFTDISKFFEK